MLNRQLQSALAILCAYALSAGTICTSQAQRSAIDTYAVRDARIVTVTGAAIERGTVVIRNGLITAVGANVTAPADARVIDGTGLTVYPGLIDANTSLGLPQPTPTPAAGGRGRGGAANAALQSATTFTSPNSTQPPGLQPEILAADQIQTGGDQIEAERSAGITAALTSPREGILIGQSAFINLDGDTPQQMIVRSPVALHVGFTPLRTGGYPNSLMGVFSAIRQMLLDAARYRESQAIYERSPRGIRRPEQDKSLAALLPVLAREMPVVMYANSEREIERALDLAKEFNLRAIIAGGLEAWKVADRLREQNVPVLVSLNFPKRTTATSTEADPETLRVLRERVEAPKNAGRLAAARVRFAFQSGAMTSMTDFLSNVSKAIQQGLARDEALRALTIRPAEILGVADRLGSIEVGKIANLTITRGDLFDSNMRISHVFIDGRPVDLKPVTPTAGGSLATGTWTLSVNLGEGDLSVTLVLQQEGERLRGSIQGALGSAEIASASVGANGDVRFTAPVTIGGQTTEATFAGNITGNEMRGSVQIVGRGQGSFNGTRAGGGSQPAATPTPTPTAQPNATPAPPKELEGTWNITFDFVGRTVPGSLTLRQQGASLAGTLQSPFGTTELSDGTISADGFRFTTSALVEGRAVEMIITGSTVGNELRGTVTSVIGSTTFTGTKPQKSKDEG